MLAERGVGILFHALTICPPTPVADSLHDGHKDFFKFKKGKKPIFTLDPPEVEGPAAEFDD